MLSLKGLKVEESAYEARGLWFESISRSLSVCLSFFMLECGIQERKLALAEIPKALLPFGAGCTAIFAAACAGSLELRDRH